MFNTVDTRNFDNEIRQPLEETKNIIKDNMLLSMKNNAILLSVAGGNLFNHNFA